jgi:hypothetical protein
MFDPSSMKWSALSDGIEGALPSPRQHHGFTSVGGRLYLHGGWTFAGFPMCQLCSLDAKLIGNLPFYILKK